MEFEARQSWIHDRLLNFVCWDLFQLAYARSCKCNYIAPENLNTSCNRKWQLVMQNAGQFIDVTQPR